MIFPVILLGVGVATLLVLALSSTDRDVPVHEPDLPPETPPSPIGSMPSTTRYKKVDAILDELKKASATSGIPLGLIIGWIARESGGRLDETTKLDERGYFQLMPSESAFLGLDHQRLSTDPVYSINAGLLLIGKYMKTVAGLGVAVAGSEYFWRLVKLVHTMGSGAVKKIITAAKAANKAGSWNTLEDYAIGHDSELLSATKHSPKKWFPLVDAVADVGRPFGFGGQTEVVGGGPAFGDIPDPLDCVKS